MADDSEKFLRIGELAAAAGVSVDTIRYYEREGVLPAPQRRGARHHAGYRLYEAQDLQRLRFVLRAKELGFSLKEIASLLALRTDGNTGCGHVREDAERHLAKIEERLRDLTRIREALLRLMKQCESQSPGEACAIMTYLGEP